MTGQSNDPKPKLVKSITASVFKGVPSPPQISLEEYKLVVADMKRVDVLAKILAGFTSYPEGRSTYSCALRRKNDLTMKENQD